MKKIITVLLAVILLPLLLSAQGDLTKLKAPTSPASNVLGLQPDAVLSPKSYNALETAIFSNFMGSEGNITVPDDFALEYTPYWITDHGLSLEEYLYPGNYLDMFFRNSSFSIASTQSFMLEDSTETNGLAFGFRTSFYFGGETDRDTIDYYRNRVLKSISNSIGVKAVRIIEVDGVENNDEFFAKIRPVILEVIAEQEGFADKKKEGRLIKTIYEKMILLPDVNETGSETFSDKFQAIVDEAVEGELYFERLKEYIKDRYGFSIDIAYGLMLNFPTNNFEYSMVPDQALWITPRYKFAEGLSFLNILGVLKYRWYNMDYYKRYFPATSNFENNIDYGIAVVAEFDRFSMKLELAGRSSSTEIPAGTDTDGNELYRKETDSDMQYIGSFDYNLTKKIVLSYSVGNRFDPLLNPDQTLVSSLSLNFAFGVPAEGN